MPLDSFAMFIKSKSLRFSRLDQMDDLYEAKPFNEKFNPLGYIFASCHTRDKTENIALWKMYSSLERGVRIELDTHDLFALTLRHHDIPVHYHEIFDYYPKYLWTCLGFEDYCNTDFILIPANENSEVNDKDNDLFIVHKDIDYIKNLEVYRNKYTSFIREKYDSQEVKIHIDLLKFGYQKLNYWEFQKESRFLIYTIPFCKNGDEINSLIKENTPILTPHIFAPLSNTALTNMTVRLSPNASEATKFIVSSLLSTIGNKNIEESDLKGHIRN